MKSAGYKILSLCLFGLVILYLFYQLSNLKRKLEIIESAFLHLKTNKLETEKEQKENSIPMEKGDSFVDDDFKEYQKLITQYVKKNINKLAPEKPAMGGSWVVSKIEFYSPELIKVIYEDGHEERVMFFKIEKAYNSDIEIKLFYNAGGAYL